MDSDQQLKKVKHCASAGSCDCSYLTWDAPALTTADSVRCESNQAADTNHSIFLYLRIAAAVLCGLSSTQHNFCYFYNVFTFKNGLQWPWVLPLFLHNTGSCTWLFCVCPPLSFHIMPNVMISTFYLSVKAMRSLFHMNNVTGQWKPSWIQSGLRLITWSTSFSRVSHSLSGFWFPSFVN